MNETPTSTPNPAAAFPGQRAAVILGAALLAGLALSLLMVLRDNARRPQLESIVEFSAVGDTRYFKIPDPLPDEPYPAVAQLEGKPLFPAGFKRHQKREADMQPLAKDAATGLTIYQAPVKAKDAGDPATLFLKIGPGEFLKLRRDDEK